MEETSCKKCNGTGKIQSPFIGLAEPMKRFGLEIGTGSMGLGLPGGIGFALAKKINEEDGKIFVVMSDGEMQIGTTWESALIASQHGLDNLTVVVDYNRFQAMGKTNEILNIEPLEDKWKAFGWEVKIIDGHNFSEIEKTITARHKKPLVIIANTIKGKGVSFMEKNNIFHYKQISQEEYKKALEELNNL